MKSCRGIILIGVAVILGACHCGKAPQERYEIVATGIEKAPQHNTVMFIPVAPKAGTLIRSTVDTSSQWRQAPGSLTGSGVVPHTYYGGDTLTQATETSVLAVRDRAAERLSVTYLLSRQTHANPGSRTYVLPASGHTYFVAADDERGPFVSSGATGGPPPSRDEVDWVRRGLRATCPTDVLLSALPLRSLAVNDSVSSLTSAVFALLGSYPTGLDKIEKTHSTIAIRLMEAQSDRARFEVLVAPLTLSDKWADAFALKCELRGTLVLRVPEGWPLELRVRGKESKKLSTMDGTAVLDATVDISFVWSYL